MPDIVDFTQDLRVSDEAPYTRLRALFAERDIDPATSWLVEIFEDDLHFQFGILVTTDKRVYQFGYHYPSGDIAAGELREWVDLTHAWRLSHFRNEIDDAFDYVDASADAP